MAAILVLILPLLGMCLAVWPGTPKVFPSGTSVPKLTSRRLTAPSVSRPRDHS